MTSLAAETRSLLHAHGVHPRKALGQNFLVDRDALDDVVRAAQLRPGDLVLEIGPGIGTLTTALLDTHGVEVVAVELDEDLARVMDARFSGSANVRLVRGNVLHMNLDDVLAPDRPYKVVANIPYYITAPIIRLFLEAPRTPRSIVLMVQREVAERLAAAPGRMSVLGVTAQFYAQVDVVRTVPASSFVPPPAVDSAVVRLRPYRTTLLPLAEADRFFALVKAGFGEKRKQLHNALVRGLAHVPAAEIDAALANVSIERTRRAETLGLEEWGALFNELGARVPRPKAKDIQGHGRGVLNTPGLQAPTAHTELLPPLSPEVAAMARRAGISVEEDL